MITGHSKTLKYLFSLSCLVFSITLTAQTPELAPSIPKPVPNPAVAYVYVSQSAASGPNQVFGFTAHENGALSSIKGSPFDADDWSMAVNGKYMFAGNSDGLSIDTYAIEPDGALKYVVCNSLSQVPAETGTHGVQLFLDHTGGTLYAELAFLDNNYALVSFAIDKATGTLALTPGYQLLEWGKYGRDYTVSASDKYIYAADAGLYAADVETIDLENWTSKTEPEPVEPPTVYPIPMFISADPLNHVAGAFAPGCGPCDGGWYTGNAQLGVYTANDEGNLTTTGTYKNMATTMFGPNQGVSDMRMAPSGKLLAISGGSGLQIFHFNGAKPITPYATLVQNKGLSFGQIRWDNNNHLFAITTDKLYVFTVTPTSIAEAPGSPYSISGDPGAQYIIVQPLPL